MTRLCFSLLVPFLLALVACNEPRHLAIFDAGGSDVLLPDTGDAGPEPRDAGFPSDAEEDAGPEDAHVCTPDCAGRVCGSDACGGTCGGCSGGAACMAGVCLDNCPANSSPSGDSCACDPGYAVGPACGTCIPDPDRDQCPDNAHPQSGRCTCDAGHIPDACACVPDPAMMCDAGSAFYCGACIDDADGNGCPANAAPGADACACVEGFQFDATGCACEEAPPSFTHPAFDSESCVGPLMTFDEANELYSMDRVLGAYQMVFRQRTCEDGRCAPWEQVSLRDIPWATQASGVAQLARIDGEMNVDLQTGLCQHHSQFNASEYIVGSRCSGIGAELVCGRYDYPGICIAASASDRVYSLLGESLRFFGQLRQDCLQLRADVSSGNVEAQAAVLVTL